MDIIDIVLGAKLGGGGSSGQRITISNVEMTEDYKLKITFSDGYVYTSAKAVRGEKGDTGRGITSFELTSTDTDKDVYTVTYTDGTTTTLTVQNSKYWHDQAEIVYNNTRTLLLNTITVTEDTTSTDVTLEVENGVRYIYGALNTLTVSAYPRTGIADIIFDSGATATVVTLPSGLTLPVWFDPTDIEVNTRYELNFADGNLVVATWPLT